RYRVHTRSQSRAVHCNRVPIGRIRLGLHHTRAAPGGGGREVAKINRVARNGRAIASHTRTHAKHQNLRRHSSELHWLSSTQSHCAVVYGPCSAIRTRIGRNPHIVRQVGCIRVRNVP